MVEAMAWLPDWPLAAKPAAAAATTWLARRRKPAGDRINPHPHERQYNKGSTHGAADASVETHPAGRRSSCPAPATTTGERSRDTGENCVTSTCTCMRTGLAIERRSLRHLTRGPLAIRVHARQTHRVYYSCLRPDLSKLVVPVT